MIILPENFKGYTFGVTSCEKIDYPQEIDPRTYIRFSEEDIVHGSDARSNINAISNAKKALHLQVELLSKAFGNEKLTKKASHGFHNKLEFCQNCGLTAPNIIRKINRVRNLTEHEYYVPNKPEVDDFIDIVSLFLSATDNFLHLFPSEIEFSFSEKTKPDLPDIVGLDFPPSEGIIYLILKPSKEQRANLTGDQIVEWQKINSLKIVASDSEPYFTWVRFIVENSYY